MRESHHKGFAELPNMAAFCKCEHCNISPAVFYRKKVFETNCGCGTHPFVPGPDWPAVRSVFPDNQVQFEAQCGCRHEKAEHHRDRDTGKDLCEVCSCIEFRPRVLNPFECRTVTSTSTSESLAGLYSLRSAVEAQKQDIEKLSAEVDVLIAKLEPAQQG